LVPDRGHGAALQQAGVFVPHFGADVDDVVPGAASEKQKSEEGQGTRPTEEIPAHSPTERVGGAMSIETWRSAKSG